MVIIIEHSRTKRRIRGAFNICGNREDLLSIAHQIIEADARHRLTYGWVEIKSERQPALKNTAPLAWDDNEIDDLEIGKKILDSITKRAGTS